MKNKNKPLYILLYGVAPIITPILVFLVGSVIMMPVFLMTISSDDFGERLSETLFYRIYQYVAMYGPYVVVAILALYITIKVIKEPKFNVFRPIFLTSIAVYYLIHFFICAISVLAPCDTGYYHFTLPGLLETFMFHLAYLVIFIISYLVCLFLKKEKSRS